jgi:hypothetical protein
MKNPSMEELEIKLDNDAEAWLRSALSLPLSGDYEKPDKRFIYSGSTAVTKTRPAGLLNFLRYYAISILPLEMSNPYSGVEFGYGTPRSGTVVTEPVVGGSAPDLVASINSIDLAKGKVSQAVGIGTFGGITWPGEDFFGGLLDVKTVRAHLGRGVRFDPLPIDSNAIFKVDISIPGSVMIPITDFSNPSSPMGGIVGIWGYVDMEVNAKRLQRQTFFYKNVREDTTELNQNFSVKGHIDLPKGTDVVQLSLYFTLVAFKEKDKYAGWVATDMADEDFYTVTGSGGLGQDGSLYVKKIHVDFCRKLI